MAQLMLVMLVNVVMPLNIMCFRWPHLDKRPGGGPVPISCLRCLLHSIQPCGFEASCCYHDILPFASILTIYWLLTPLHYSKVSVR